MAKKRIILSPHRLKKFLRRVEVDEVTKCWNWTGHVNQHGRGTMVIDGRKHHVYRVAYETWVGPIPEGYSIHHNCGNRRCVNPHHLRSTTPDSHRVTHRERG